MQAIAFNLIRRSFNLKETGIVYVRMDKEIKEQAEEILDELGISASWAVTMFYKTIIREKRITTKSVNK